MIIKWQPSFYKYDNVKVTKYLNLDLNDFYLHEGVALNSMLMFIDENPSLDESIVDLIKTEDIDNLIIAFQMISEL